MPGNPDAVPQPPAWPSWVGTHVESLIAETLLASFWVPESAQGHIGNIAGEITAALYRAGLLRQPGGWTEPTWDDRVTASEQVLSEYLGRELTEEEREYMSTKLGDQNPT